MVRRDVTRVSERLKFVWLWVEGKSLRAIARETGVGATTVSRWIRRWLHEGHVHLRQHIRKETHVNNNTKTTALLLQKQQQAAYMQDTRTALLQQAAHQQDTRTTLQQAAHQQDTRTQLLLLQQQQQAAHQRQESSSYLMFEEFRRAHLLPHVIDAGQFVYHHYHPPPHLYPHHIPYYTDVDKMPMWNLRLH
ncbi:hypothetical protein Pcinc_029504 [Petrolisthes cinctipes]|uniref:Uncharacterized protein n=1 Tax=Petrolisthes cinctipes TaxID=88211 RepID=A0AAE1F0W1_PETCI|nr:hypothetical protein Pcinc_029504 [Petrolisthes cinctipes]